MEVFCVQCVVLSMQCSVCSVLCAVYSEQCAVCVNHIFILSYARGVQRVIGNLSKMARCRDFIISLTASAIDICNDGVVH